MRAFLFVFILVSAAILAAAHVYFYRRLVRDVTERPNARKVGVWAFGALGVAALIARPATFYLPDVGARPVLLAILIWIGVSMYLTAVLAVLDLLRWLSLRKAPQPVSPERRLLLSQGVATAAVIATGGISAIGLRSAFAAPELTEVPVRLPGLPKQLEGYSIVQLTDVHVGSVIQERFLDQLVRVANGARPDAVVITGDLVDGSVSELGRFVARLQHLQSRQGVHFVTGNHDHYSGAAEWCAALGGLGWTVLRNRGLVLGDRAPGGASFDLFGVDDFKAERNGGGRYDLQGALAGRDPSRASVLLAHQPRDLPAVSAAGVGLMISGHTHGGQMFPGTIVGDLMWGRHNEGLAPIEGGDSQLFVSRGCGFVGPPMRVDAAPQVVKLVLLPA